MRRTTISYLSKTIAVGSKVSNHGVRSVYTMVPTFSLVVKNRCAITYHVSLYHACRCRSNQSVLAAQHALLSGNVLLSKQLRISTIKRKNIEVNMAPVDNSPASNVAGFELICSLKSNDIIPVHKYKSLNTGITVFIAEVEGPVVCGYLCLATEAHDDDGLPHTLEHLIFMGSEKYPYKGVLDLLANRCLASGTNACTDVDNTYYTMETIGGEGFLKLLPIYLDHILFPTLTDSAFTTEVHHITGEGEDAGVVYCEMQGSENVGEVLVHTELTRAIYPGFCGYKSVTGGALKNLRESTTNEKVRKYHKEFYKPENLCIIIAGKVKHAEVFKSLEPLEEKIISKGDRGLFTRPWQSEVPPFDKNVDLNIYYPCNDEDNGLVLIGWRGPSAVSNINDLLGCTLLLKYLTDTSASPLQKEFVEIEDPLASDVDFSLQENSESLLYLSFSSVPKSKISEISSCLKSVLSNIAESENGIDMQRMNTVIHRYLLETLSNLESNPHDAIAFTIIGDFLFGNNKEDLDGRLNEINRIEKLKSKSASYWLQLLKQYFIDRPCVVAKGIPSRKKEQELADTELERLSKQIKRLGPKELKKKEEALLKSIEQNETPIPEQIIKSVSIPSTDSVNFHHVQSFYTDGQQHPKFDLNKLPFYTSLQHLNTNFVYLLAIMDTNKISPERRPYIPLILDSILESPIIRDGKIIPYETVVSELEMDTIGASTRLGLQADSKFSCGSYGQHVILILQLEIAKYAKGVKWIKELLHQSQFVPKRLKVIATKTINDVSEVKRKGSKVVYDLMKSLIYKQESNSYNTSMLRQHQFLTNMVNRLNSEKEKSEVLTEIEEVRNTITSMENIVMFLAVNVDKLTNQVSDLYKPWEEFSVSDNSKKTKLNPVPDYKVIKPFTEIDISGCVTGLGCVESSYLLQCCRGIEDPMDQDIPALLVCIQYFTQLEGPMWRQIRGQGFAYSYSIYIKSVEGLIYLSFYKATNITAAYKEAQNIISNHLSDNNKWDSSLLESAKSSLIYEVLQKEKSIGDSIFNVLFNIFQGVPTDYNRYIIKSVSNVTLKDCERVARQYLEPLFDPKKSKTTIVCHPSKSGEIVKTFKELGHDLKLYKSLEQSYLNSW